KPFVSGLVVALVVGFALPRFAGAQVPVVDTVTYSLAGGEYKPISFPLVVADSSVGGVFPDVGPADDTKWRMFSWSALDSSYLELGTSSNLDVGQGYWIITRGSGTLTAIGGVNPSRGTIRLNVTRDGARPAWNFFGFPGAAPLSVAAVQVSTPLVVFALANPNNNLTEHVIKEWRPSTSSYVNASVLQPGSAYWLRALVPGVSLLLTSAPSAVASGPGVETAPPEGADWA